MIIMKLIKNNNSLSAAYSLKNNFYLITQNKLKQKLRNLSKNFKIQARICLHKNIKDTLHQMIIFQPKNTIPKIKKHPNKDKTYILINGKHVVEIFDQKKKIVKKIILKKYNILNLKKNIYHRNYSISEKSIHLEIISGPFDKYNDQKF